MPPITARDGLIHHYRLVFRADTPPAEVRFQVARAEERLYRQTGLAPADHRVWWRTIPAPMNGYASLLAQLVAREQWPAVERQQRRAPAAP